MSTHVYHHWVNVWDAKQARYVPVLCEIEVDTSKLARALGPRAQLNKSKTSKLACGVTVRIAKE